MGMLEIAGGIILAVLFFAFLPLITLLVILAIPAGIFVLWPDDTMQGLSFVGKVAFWLFTPVIFIQFFLSIIDRVKKKKLDNTLLDNFFSDLLSAKEIYKGIMQIILGLTLFVLVMVVKHNF